MFQTAFLIKKMEDKRIIPIIAKKEYIVNIYSLNELNYYCIIRNRNEFGEFLNKLSNEEKISVLELENNLEEVEHKSAKNKADYTTDFL